MWGGNANKSFTFGNEGQGFMKQDDFQSPGTGSSQNEKQKKFRSQSLVPVTIGHVHEAMKTTDTFKIGETEINMVSIVGLVVSVEQKMTHIAYEVNDMTGPPISIQHWMDDSNDGSDRSPMIENTYVQVYGSVKKMRDNLIINVFKIKAITDLNCLTVHLLEVMQARKSLEKLHQMRNNKIGAPTHDSTNAGGDTSGMEAMDIDSNGAPAPEGLTKVQAAIYKTIRSYRDASGCTIDWLREQLSSLNSASLSQAMTFLCDEGHVYTTIDDNHFQVTETG